MLLAVDTSAAPPYPYVALRIEPDRLSIIAYDGTTIRELDSVQGATAANTWYTVQLRIVAGGPTGGTLSVERVSGTAGEAVATLMQSVPLSELPAIENSAIGFTVGELAGYQFQLVKYADAPDLSESFVDWSYDAYGRKVAETVYDNANAVTSQTLYVWDGWRLVSELDGLNGNRVVAEYVPGPTYVDDVVAARRDQNRDGDFNDAYEGFLYYLTDQQHSTVALLDGTGTVAERYGYDAFGAPSFHNGSGSPIAASAVGNDRLYTGRQWLPALKLYDYRQRLYDPAMGRFLTRDPVYDPANLGNPYTYVGNNPGAFVDPYGEVAETVWDVASLGLGAGSLGFNLYQGNYFDALLDTVGVAADGVAALVPFVPGGAGVAIKSHRAFQAMRAADTVVSVGQGLAAGIDAGIAYNQGDTTGTLVNGTVAALQAGVVGARVGSKFMRGSEISPNIVPVSIKTAKQLDEPNRGIIYMFESQADITKPFAAYDAGTLGACSDIATRQRIVPALRFDNARGYNFVRLDGVDPLDPMLLVNRKLSLTTKSKQVDDMRRLAEALRQNVSYRAVFEFPTEKTARRGDAILKKVGVADVINVRISP